MKKVLFFGFAFALGANAMAQDDILLNGVNVWEGTVGVKANTGVGAGDAGDIYSNKTTFTGFSVSNGGTANQAGNLITRLNADDLITLSPGLTVDGFTFSVGNLNSVAVSARPRVRFYADNAGVPGALLAGFSFNAISFGANSVGLFNASAPAAFVMPANGRVWAGMTFDNNTGATGATAAQMDLLGQGTFNTPTIGSSADLFFQTTAAGSHFNSDPAGSLLFFNGNPVANFGWSLSSNAVPEPASMLAIGLGIAGLAAKRRRKSA